MDRSILHVLTKSAVDAAKNEPYELSDILYLLIPICRTTNSIHGLICRPETRFLSTCVAPAYGLRDLNYRTPDIHIGAHTQTMNTGVKASRGDLNSD